MVVHKLSKDNVDSVFEVNRLTATRLTDTDTHLPLGLVSTDTLAVFGQSLLLCFFPIMVYSDTTSAM